MIPANTLFIHIEGTEDNLLIHAEINTHTTSYSIKWLDDLRTLYPLLQSIERKKNTETIEPLLKEGGLHIFEPITPLIQSSSEVVFIIPNSLLKLPLDLLYIHGIPLFLQKPITYSFTTITSQPWQFSNKLSALIMSDKDTDPDRGAYFVKELLPSAEYYDISRNINELDLSRLTTIPPKDIVLISAHGQISFDENDHIVLGEEQIVPPHLSRLCPKLIYLDSCQMGISNRFIQDFRNVGTMYNIAPITSNEAGNSSTKTINFFFKAFQEGSSPPMALFLARKKLYTHFEMSDSFEFLLWRAFPFRVYRLN